MTDTPRGPVQFFLHHGPTGRLLRTYPSGADASAARDAFEREDDPEGAARGDYKVSWSFTFKIPKTEPHRFDLAGLTYNFGPICSVCGLPVDLAAHTNRKEAWAFNGRLLSTFVGRPTDGSSGPSTIGLGTRQSARFR